MRLLPLLCLAVVTLASASAEGQLYIKVTGAGFVEHYQQRTWTVTLQVENQAQKPQIIMPGDFQGLDAFGNTYQFQGERVELPPAGNSSIGLQTVGKTAPRSLTYTPEKLSLDLRSWL